MAQTALVSLEGEPLKKTPRQMVEEFMVAFEHNPDEALCHKLIREETAEVAEAVCNLLKEFCDLIYVVEQANSKGFFHTLDPQTLANVASLMKWYAPVFSEGQLADAFERVHASNMSKLVDGKPIRREDGKVLKGPNYKAPDLMDLV